MQAIILAAGRGTRIRPLSDTTPKTMLPVATKPIGAHVADAAVAAGAEKLVFTIGYRPDGIRDYFGTTYRGVPVEYATQSKRDGTAAAVVAAIDHIEGPFAVLNGDNLYTERCLSKLFNHVPAVGYTRVESPEEYGVISTDGNIVTGIVEKPRNPSSNVVNTGAYSFPEETRDLLDVPVSDRGERELTDVLRRVIERYEVTGVEFVDWADIGYPWDLLNANERLLENIAQHIAGDVHEGAHLQGPVVVEQDATIGAGSVIEGPVLVRRGASIGPNAYIRGASVIGEGASVGHSVEVKNSVLMTNSRANHLSYIGDSIVGPEANIGAGTMVANLRHDEKAIRAGPEQYSTGRRKFGAVIGPGSKTAINTSLNPGVVLSAYSWTKPGEVVTTSR